MLVRQTNKICQLIIPSTHIDTAKILMDAGSGADIPVGTPIMVTVEELADVAAFADFVLEASAPPPAPAVAAPTPTVVSAPVPVAAPTPAPVVVAAAPVVPPAAPVPVAVSVPPPSMKALIEAVAPVMSTGWGDFAKLNSPILKTLSKQQAGYVEKYGSTGQIPL